MNISPENILLVGSTLLLVSILAGKTTARFGVPTLLFFLVVGVLAGSEGIGGINFTDAHVAHLIGIVALNFILFSGGLDTEWETIRPILWKGIALSTAGVFITALSVGLFAYLVFGLPLLQGLLLGAIVSSTDAAAVFSVLRNSGIGLKGSVRPLLELESGSNDPMAYFLTVSLTTFIGNPHMAFYPLAALFFKGFIIGSLMGFAMGKLTPWVINHIRLDGDGLYPVMVLGMAMLTYSATDFLGGNGFLAIYLCAVLLGNSNFIHKKSMLRFYDGQAWLMQIILFLTLGLLVFPSRIVPVAGMGLLISGFLIFIARPLGVFASLYFFKMNTRSKMFLSWAGLRGAVPIVFAIYPVMAGIPGADFIFNLVFFISVTSVLLQGTSLSFVARWLHVAVPSNVKRKAAADAGTIEIGMPEIIGVNVEPRSAADGKKIVLLGMPPGTHIITIKRNGKYILPAGSTRLEAGDELTVMAANQETLRSLPVFFETPNAKQADT